jgi:hypothetical protein
MRARKAIPAVVTAAVALVAAGSASALTSSYSDGPLTATFTAATHHPSCKQNWPVKVTVRYHGQPAHASAIYQFLVGGQLVNTQYPLGGTPKNPHYHVYHFYGSFYDYKFGPFGALAEGHTIDVRAVVSVGRYTAYPGTWVRVVKAKGCPAE